MILTVSCQNSAETEILLDRAARTAGAAHHPAQGPHGHRTPLKSTAYRATGAGQSYSQDLNESRKRETGASAPPGEPWRPPKPDGKVTPVLE